MEGSERRRIDVVLDVHHGGEEVFAEEPPEIEVPHPEVECVRNDSAARVHGAGNSDADGLEGGHPHVGQASQFLDGVDRCRKHCFFAPSRGQPQPVGDEPVAVENDGVGVRPADVHADPHPVSSPCRSAAPSPDAVSGDVSHAASASPTKRDAPKVATSA